MTPNLVAFLDMQRALRVEIRRAVLFDLFSMLQRFCLCGTQCTDVWPVNFSNC